MATSKADIAPAIQKLREVYADAPEVGRVGLEKMIAEMGSQPRVIATGGLAPMIAGASKFIEKIDETLTLDGLRLIYERNNPQTTQI